MIRGEPVKVKGRSRPIELLFNLEHPDQISLITEVDDNTTEATDKLVDTSDDHPCSHLSATASFWQSGNG